MAAKKTNKAKSKHQAKKLPATDLELGFAVREFVEAIPLPIVFANEGTLQMKKEALGIVLYAAKRGFISDHDIYGYGR